MVRGLIAGLATGGVVAVLGLGALSLVAPLPRPNATTPPASATGEDTPAARGAAPRTPRLPVPANSPAPIVAAPGPTAPGPTAPRLAAPSAPPPTIAPAAPLAEAPAPSLPPPAALAGAGDAAPVAPAGEGVTAAEPVVPAPPAPVAEPAATPLPGTESAARPDAVATAPASPAAPEAPLAMREPGAEAPVPVPPPGEVVAPELPQAEADEAAVARSVPVPAAPAAPPAAAAADDDAAPATSRAPEPGQEIVLLPDGAIVPPAAQLPRVFSPGDAPQGFANAPGTAVNRLPTIGDETQVATAPAPGFLRPPGAEAPAGALAGGPPPATAAVPAPAAPAPRGDEAPIRRYGAAFTPEPGKPLFSVVLIDPGTAAGGLDSGTIRALGLPLTIAIDPTRPDAAAAAAAYRAAGLEVAILASPLPEGATVQDLEVALEAWRAVLPEAVAVVEPPKPVVQNNRLLSQDLVAVLGREGLGLVTQSGGTNAAEQLARAADLPEVRVWRVLDADRERGAVVERTLARAAFEAARDGAVTVMLSAWPESISGLTSWSVGATGTVNFAPVSALALAQMQNGG